MRAAVTGTACLCAAGDSPEAVLRAMTEGGVEMGFYPNEAKEIAMQTMQGAVAFTFGKLIHPAKRLSGRDGITPNAKSGDVTVSVGEPSARRYTG